MSVIRPLELNDRLIVKDYLRRYPPEISELTFTNLYVWRDSRPIFLAEIEDSIVFVTKTGEEGDGGNFILGHPVGGASPLSVVNALGIEVTGLIRVPKNTADILSDTDLLVTTDRDNSDYLYRVTDLAELAGRRFHKKRNLVKQCLSAYRCEYEALTPELIVECSDMQDRWCKARNCGKDPGLCSEYMAIRNMFDHFEDLQVIGGAIRVDGIIHAYAIGEELSPGTAVCHFEKAMPGLRGLGQLINQWFARYALRGFEFENREQDLGIPGLRQAKESYYPHHMVEKFNVWFSAVGPDIGLLPVDPRECERHGQNELVQEV
jgi:hypothetical protein